MLSNRFWYWHLLKCSDGLLESGNIVVHDMLTFATKRFYDTVFHQGIGCRVVKKAKFLQQDSLHDHADFSAEPLFFGDLKCIDDPEFKFLIDNDSLEILWQGLEDLFRGCWSVDDEPTTLTDTIQDSVSFVQECGVMDTSSTRTFVRSSAKG